MVGFAGPLSVCSVFAAPLFPMKSILLSIKAGADKIAIVANAVGTLVVLALVCVVNYDVVVRGAGGYPFKGTYEVVQFTMVLIVFLQLPDVVRVNRLTRSDGFLSIMGDRFPGFVSLLGRLINAVSCVFMLLVAVATFPDVVEMWETKDYFGVPGVFTAPWWPVKLVIFLSACLCCFLFAMMVFFPKGNEVKLVTLDKKENHQEGIV